MAPLILCKRNRLADDEPGSRKKMKVTQIQEEEDYTPSAMPKDEYTPSTPNSYASWEEYTPATPPSSPDYTPTTPPSSPDYTPATPPYSPDYTPATPPFSPDYTPSTPLSMSFSWEEYSPATPPARPATPQSVFIRANSNVMFNVTQQGLMVKLFHRH